MQDYITLDEAAKLVPDEPSHTTIWRWCARGIYVRGSDKPVRMRFVRIGRKYYTTADWVTEFIHRLTAATLFSHEHPKVRNGSKERMRQLAEADEILARAGI